MTPPIEHQSAFSAYRAPTQLGLNFSLNARALQAPDEARLEAYRSISSAAIIPVFSSSKHEINVKAVEIAVEAGFKIFEWTFRQNGAEALFSKLNEHIVGHKLPIMLGAGTISYPEEAEKAMNAGAKFLVGPTFGIAGHQIAELARQKHIAYSPGCATPTELLDASLIVGAPKEEVILKVFPGDSAGGPNFVKSVLATRKGKEPYRIMVTGGVEPTRNGLEKWFEAGVVAVGAGSNLLKESDIEHGQDFASIVAKLKLARETALEFKQIYSAK